MKIYHHLPPFHHRLSHCFINCPKTHNSWHTLTRNYSPRAFSHKRNKINIRICKSCDSNRDFSIPKICIMDIVCTSRPLQILWITCLILTLNELLDFIHMFCRNVLMSYILDSNFSYISYMRSLLCPLWIQMHKNSQQLDTRSYFLCFFRHNCAM